MDRYFAKFAFRAFQCKILFRKIFSANFAQLNISHFSRISVTLFTTYGAIQVRTDILKLNSITLNLATQVLKFIQKIKFDSEFVLSTMFYNSILISTHGEFRKFCEILGSKFRILWNSKSAKFRPLYIWHELDLSDSFLFSIVEMVVANAPQML